MSGANMLQSWEATAICTPDKYSGSEEFTSMTKDVFSPGKTGASIVTWLTLKS